jgi:protein phosphatase
VKKFLDTIFGQKTASEMDVPTQPLPPVAVPAPPKRQALEPTQFIVGCAQSVGRQRDHNEDALFTLTTTLTSADGSVPFGLYIVADGMGGHQFGEVASGIAIRAVASTVVRKLYTTLLSLQPSPPEQSLLEIMQEGSQEAHRAIARRCPGEERP